MSVLIKGMEMPKSCYHCPLVRDVHSSVICPVKRHVIEDSLEERSSFCPLVEVPPHGRLGDLEELYNHLNEWYLTHEHGFLGNEKIYIRAMLSGVKDSPTIIEAEE